MFSNTLIVVVWAFIIGNIICFIIPVTIATVMIMCLIYFLYHRKIKKNKNSACKLNEKYVKDIIELRRKGHTKRCALRMLFGDGKCECDMSHK